jgi:hypothetical protein
VNKDVGDDAVRQILAIIKYATDLQDNSPPLPDEKLNRGESIREYLVDLQQRQPGQPTSLTPRSDGCRPASQRQCAGGYLKKWEHTNGRKFDWEAYSKGGQFASGTVVRVQPPQAQRQLAAQIGISRYTMQEAMLILRYAPKEAEAAKKQAADSTKGWSVVPHPRCIVAWLNGSANMHRLCWFDSLFW